MWINGLGVVTFYLLMDSVRSLCYIGSRMGHVIVYCIGWVLVELPVQRRLYPIFVKFGSR